MHNENSASITAIVLAAGLGSRFGGDKLLTPIQLNSADQALPLGVVSALNIKPHVDNVICVVRPNDLTLKQQFASHGFSTVDNFDYKQGLSSSIITGVKACNDNSHYLICLADMPYILSPTYSAIIKSFKANLDTQLNKGLGKKLIEPLNENTNTNTKSGIFRPVLLAGNNIGKDKAGHPVLFNKKYRQALLQITGDNGAQALIKKYGVTTIQLTDQGIIQDIDRSEDIKCT
jgi:molybdenum cofactor cytidylyltransferase